MDSYWQWNKDNFPWHYDPSSKESDVQYVGRFISDRLQEGVDNVVKNFTENDVYDEVSIKGEPFNDEAKEIMEGYHNDLTRAGYTSHNTGGRQTRENLPAIFSILGEVSGLWNPQLMFLEQPPGKFVPWHRDSYNNYRRNYWR